MIGRAGVGVDNVDVPAATKRGIVVVNAPQSNVVTAAEHTMAMLLALARNVPQAHAALVAGRGRARSTLGIELMDKTLGILGFGRIGRLVADARRASGCACWRTTRSSAPSVQRARRRKGRDARRLLAPADFLTAPLPKTPETKGSLEARRRQVQARRWVSTSPTGR